MSILRTPASTVTGRSGTQLARDGMAAVARAMRRNAIYTDGPVRRIADLGDRAWGTRHRTWFQRGDVEIDWYAAGVVVQRGDLTLAVRLQSRLVDSETLHQRAVELARTALATQG